MKLKLTDGEQVSAYILSDCGSLDRDKAPLPMGSVIVHNSDVS